MITARYRSSLVVRLLTLLRTNRRCVGPLQEWEKLWTINKRLIDPVAPRHTAVTAAGRVPLTLSNGPEVGYFILAKAPHLTRKASYSKLSFPLKIAIVSSCLI